MPIRINNVSSAATRDGRTQETKGASLYATGAGDKTIVTGVSGYQIYVLAVAMNMPGAGTFTFKSGSTTKFAIQGGNGFDIEIDPGSWPLVVCADGESFTVSHSGGSTVNVHVRYCMVPV